MSTVVLDYNQMVQAMWAAQSTAWKCGEYTEEIQRKVTQKLDSLERGSNSLVSSANYFAQQKIADLNRKREQFEQYGNHVIEAMRYAEDTDNRVSSYIKTESREFRRNHGMEVNVVIEFFAWISTNVLNSTEFGRWLNQKMRAMENWVDRSRRRFKQWFHLEGGKYIIKIVTNILLTVAAVVIVIFVALPALMGAVAAIAANGVMLGSLWTVLTATASFVTSFIKIFDCVTKVGGNMAALESLEEDPGWAHRYGSYSSFAEYLRKTNFHDGYLNKLSYIHANTIDTVAFAAQLIHAADTAHRGINFLKGIKANGTRHYFKKVRFKTKNGKVSWATFKYGIKSIRQNAKTANEAINNTNINRLNKYYKKAANIDIVYKFETGASKTEKFIDKGFGKYFGDIIGKKIRENIIGADFIVSLKNCYDTGTRLAHTYKNTRFGY